MGIEKFIGISITVVITTLFIMTVSCDKEHDENETKISKYNSSESHNAGENCMSCHKSGGEGEGWFNVAGTVYESSLSSIYPNSTITLTTEPNGAGNSVITIQGDARGNFYTTESVNFGTGLYVKLEGTSGEIMYMSSKISSGACSSCHGASTSRVHL